jgi:hypothetical protein
MSEDELEGFDDSTLSMDIVSVIIIEEFNCTKQWKRCSEVQNIIKMITHNVNFLSQKFHNPNIQPIKYLIFNSYHIYHIYHIYHVSPGTQVNVD